MHLKLLGVYSVEKTEEYSSLISVSNYVIRKELGRGLFTLVDLAEDKFLRGKVAMEKHVSAKKHIIIIINGIDLSCLITTQS